MTGSDSVREQAEQLDSPDTEAQVDRADGDVPQNPALPRFLDAGSGKGSGGGRTVPWDRITAIASVVVAVSAIVSSHTSEVRNRDLAQALADEQNSFLSKQNELVKGQFDKQVANDIVASLPHVEIIRDFAVTSEEPGLYLRNTGLGPAYVHDVSFYGEDDALVARADSEAQMRQVLDNHGINWEKVRWRSLNDVFGILPGEAVPMVSVYRRHLRTCPESYYRSSFQPRGAQCDEESFYNAVRSMKVALCFCSIYRQCFARAPWSLADPTPETCEEPSYERAIQAESP